MSFTKYVEKEANIKKKIYLLNKYFQGKSLEERTKINFEEKFYFEKKCLGKEYLSINNKNEQFCSIYKFNKNACAYMGLTLENEIDKCLCNYALANAENHGSFFIVNLINWIN